MGALEDCVSRKMPKLISEGYDQDQAVAVAYSMCGEKALETGETILTWDDLSDQQRAWWLAQAGQWVTTRVDGIGKNTRVKTLAQDRIGGYGVVWGDAQHTDLTGEYFTRSSNFWLEHYDNQPVIFDHALGKLPGSLDDMPAHFKFGHIVKVTPDDIGLWIEAQIDEHNDWVQAVLELINKGVLHWSSGSVPHLVKRRDDGWLESWPIVEWSTTAAPAEPRYTHVVVLKHYVNDQDQKSRPEALSTQDARAADKPDVLHSKTNPQLKEEITMSLILTPETVRGMVWAYADNNIAALKGALDTVKQEGDQSNAITDMLRPLAEELAGMSGASVDDTLAYLIAWVADHAASDTQPPPEAAPAEVPVMGAAPEPTTLSISKTDLEKMLNAAAAKAVQAALPDQPSAALYRAKNVNINSGHDDRPPTLGRWIKATRDKDYAYLNQWHGRIKAQYKALGINPDTAGGYLVPTEQSTQIIELLRADATVLPLCQTLPMNSDTLIIPKLTGGATTYWTAENAQLTAADAAFGPLQLVAKKLTIMMKISNELINDSDPSVDALIRADMARAAASEIDRVILEGTGVANEPLGLANSGATATALNALCTYVNINDAMGRVEAEDVAKAPPWAWVINPREKKNWRELEDPAGNLVWVGAQAPGNIGQSNPPTMLESSVYTTTGITIDTDNNDETRVYFGQWNDVMVGMRKALEIRASDEAGDSFEYDQTWIRAILRMDVGLRHDESIEILTDVRGA